MLIEKLAAVVVACCAGGAIEAYAVDNFDFLCPWFGIRILELIDKVRFFAYCYRYLSLIFIRESDEVMSDKLSL